MEKWKAMLWNTFPCLSAQKAGRKGLKVRIRTRHGERILMLPRGRKHVILDPARREISIREWLCERWSLFEPRKAGRNRQKGDENV